MSPHRSLKNYSAMSRALPALAATALLCTLICTAIALPAAIMRVPVVLGTTAFPLPLIRKRNE